MPPRIQEYLKPEFQNFAEGFLTDACGRFLTLLDNIVYFTKTDEREFGIYLSGRVIAIFDDDNIVEVKSDVFLPAEYIHNSCVIRLPNRFSRFFGELTSYFTFLNTQLLSKFDLHKNGYRLRIL